MITMVGNKKYRADLYLRLSREHIEDIGAEEKVKNVDLDYERDRESGSITTQRSFLTNFCEENGIIINNIYADDGYSGANFDRPGFKKMIQDIEDGKINMVIVKDLSRLGRVSSRVTYYTDEYFPEKRIRFIAVADAIDSGLQDTSGDEMAQFKAFFNEWFLRDVSKKIRTGKKARAKSGKVMVTYPTYGYKKDPMNKNHYIVDEEIAPIVKEIFELAKEGKTPTQIAKVMTDKKYKVPSDVVGNTHTRSSTEIKRGWNRNSIKRILTNQVYLGYVVSGKIKKVNYKSKKILLMPENDWIVVKNQHEPLIDEDTFDLVQQLIKSRTRVKKRKHDWLLCGLLFCEECGKQLSICNPNGNEVFYTKCNTYSVNTYLHLCTPHNNQLENLTQAILNNIRETCKIFLEQEKENYNQISRDCYKKYESNKNTSEKEISALTRKIRVLEKKIDNLYDDKVNGKIKVSDFDRIYGDTVNEKMLAQDRIDFIKKTLTNDKKMIDYDKIVSDFVNMKNITRPILVQLVEKITIDKNKNVKIYYKFNTLNEISNKRKVEKIPVKNRKTELKIS